ncbi:class II aldolase/adducin family protein [Teichococcus aestuarii]|uniref:class II aldolase/adducin family protein n=1 Tax=Teichococcus aestuarii TaxID=568898 RepID=UPI003616D201
MAHALGAPGAPAILRNSDLDADAVRQARVDLAACFRMAARLGLHEGICNHLSAMVPGREDLFLVNPYGRPSPRSPPPACWSATSTAMWWRGRARRRPRPSTSTPGCT